MAQLTRLLRALQHWIERRWLLRSPSLHGQATTEDSEGLLDQEKGHAVHPTTTINRLWRYLALFGVASLVLWLLTAVYRNRPRPRLLSHRNTQTLHLVILTSELDPELCKTVLSSEILHYSTPTLLQWDAVAGEDLANAQRRTRAVRDYLGKLNEDNENDTVVLLDSMSTWFPLRPEVLLKRYYGIINGGNQRLAARFGEEVTQEEGFKQSVVFTASLTRGAAEEQCSQVPESPLTIKASWTPAPRFLEQGMVIGPVKDLLKIYRRAVLIIRRTEDFHLSELAVLSEMFSDQ
jgi:hypothetical protein